MQMKNDLITIEDLDKIDSEIIWYDSLMTKQEFCQFTQEYENFMQRTQGEWRYF